jgi:hypothetical protein
MIILNQRISYNTRYFSGNYGVVIAILAVYALSVVIFAAVWGRTAAI